MRRFVGSLCLALAWGASSPGYPAAPEKTERPPEARPPARMATASFEGLFASYVKADRAGDAEGARRAFQELRRLRIERNVLNLEEIGLALVAQGKEKLDKGERDAAAEMFASASSLAPNLPDAHLGLALAEVKRGPLGYAPAVKSAVEAVLARLPTVRGRYLGVLSRVPLLGIAVFVAGAIFATAMVFRHGPLLRHDLEEALGSARSRSVALALHLLLLLLPVAIFQGWGWLFPWWLGVLFVYMGLAEKAVALLLLLASLLVGPALKTTADSLEAARNPAFWAAVSSVEGASERGASIRLERASKTTPDDRDLVYLYAAQLRKAGRYDEAANLYRDLLKSSPGDPVAVNNLANLEFARGEFQSALSRYKEAGQKATDNELKATFFYNQSLAHLQKFEMQPADEALSQARRFSAGLIANFDRFWKYDKGDYAVVDLGLTSEEVEQKFLGLAQGTGRKNVWGKPGPEAEPIVKSMVNRFSAFLGVIALTVIALAFWRGRKTFTMRCLKCGTPFCRRCHLGAAVAGLCSQCYHLFVVRDGVSGPARNRKLLEVQAEEGRQDGAFRLLSLLLPGAGQVYRGAPLLGFLLSFLWALVLAAVLLLGRVFPVTEAPRWLSGPPLGPLAAGLVLLGIYVVAGRAKPAADVVVPVRRGATRGKGRA